MYEIILELLLKGIVGDNVLVVAGAAGVRLNFQSTTIENKFLQVRL
jgi:hypothetical protein